MAGYLYSEALWEVAPLFRVAPISNNHVLAYLARHLFGMPDSY